MKFFHKLFSPHVFVKYWWFLRVFVNNGVTRVVQPSKCRCGSVDCKTKKKLLFLRDKYKRDEFQLFDIAVKYTFRERYDLIPSSGDVRYPNSILIKLFISDQIVQT